MSKRNVLQVNMKAGDHAFFHHRHPDTKESLEDLGYLEYGNAPADFEPDLQKLAKDHKSIATIASAIEGYDSSQIRILMWTLNQSHHLLKHGLKFGQVVYKNMGGEAYLDNWFRCYVLSAGPMLNQVQYVRLTGSLDDIHGTLILCPLDSFLDHSEFSLIRRNLVSQGRLRSPKSVRDKVLHHKQPMAASKDFPSLHDIADQLVKHKAPRRRAVDQVMIDQVTGKPTKRLKKFGSTSSTTVTITTR